MSTCGPVVYGCPQVDEHPNGGEVLPQAGQHERGQTLVQV